MDEKRATTILLLLFAAVFVYSVFMRDSVDDSAVAFQGQLARQGHVVSFEQVASSQSHTALLAQAFAAGPTSSPGPFATMASRSSSLTGAAVRSLSSTTSKQKQLLLAAFGQGKPAGSSTLFYKYLQSQGGNKK